MAENTKSQVASGGSHIVNSNNNNDNENSTFNNSALVKKVRTESIFISFIVGFLASLLASYLYEKLMH